MTDTTSTTASLTAGPLSTIGLAAPAVSPPVHPATPHYRAPGWFTRNVANRSVAFLTRRGLSIWGSRVLEVRGRTSGQPRRTPVNVLTHEGERYLVSARGEGQWVRNVRAAHGELALILGRHREEVVATELGDDEKVPVLRAYLTRWKAEVGVFFDGLDGESSDEEIRAIADQHPVFVLHGRTDS
jgi:deazaflavin-dependent oxidoreductase (nitroreductase family)